MLLIFSLTGFAEKASADTIYTICDDCTALEKTNRAKDVIAGNPDTIVIMGDIAARTVVRHIVLVQDFAQGIQYSYRSTTLSTTSFEHNEYKKLWDVVNMFPSYPQSVTVPVDIAETPWDLIGVDGVETQDAVLQWYDHRSVSVFDSAAWAQAMEDVFAAVTGTFLGSYAIKLYFSDGGFIVLRFKGFISGEGTLPDWEWEVDLSASRDGAGNQIVPVSGEDAVIGSLGSNGQFSSGGFTSNFIISGNWSFPGSSSGGGVCSSKSVPGGVIISCMLY